MPMVLILSCLIIFVQADFIWIVIMQLFCLFQRDLTGVDNLEEVHYLEMKVDTRDTSLGNFGCHLPNLAQLKLSNSIIQSVR